MIFNLWFALPSPSETVLPIEMPFYWSNEINKLITGVKRRAMSKDMADSENRTPDFILVVCCNLGLLPITNVTRLTIFVIYAKTPWCNFLCFRHFPDSGHQRGPKRHFMQRNHVF